MRDPKRCMSENTVNAALRNLGYDGNTIVGHGFRHMASTLLNELGFNPDAIERQLAHKGQGVRAIYNLAKHMPERKKMMQAWADYLDACKELGVNGQLKYKAAGLSRGESACGRECIPFPFLEPPRQEEYSMHSAQSDVRCPIHNRFPSGSSIRNSLMP